jgi:hypothetical protein
MTSKFHWTPRGVLWLAGQLSGSKRTEMPGVMPKAREGDALNNLRDLYIEFPAFQGLDILNPTTEIILAMCKTLVSVADKLAALPADSSDKTIAATCHPSNFNLLKRGSWR